MRTILLLLFVAGSFLAAYAQHTPRPVLLQNATLHPQPTASVEAPTAWSNLAPFDEAYHVLVQFSALPDATTRNHLERHGIQLHEYLPHYTYYATVDQQAQPSDLAQADITHIWQLRPEEKLHPWLVEGPLPDYIVLPDNRWEVNLIPYPTVPASTIAEALAAFGIAPKEQPYANRVTVHLEPQQLTTLAKLPFIRFIEPGDAPPEPENYTARTLTRSNAIDTEFGAGRQYTGKNVTVGLQDDGLISNHIDYTGRVTQNANGDGGNHGDHIAGTIMGAGNLEPVARGMAYEGHLYVRWVYDIISNMYNHYNNDDVYITSTSYSNGCNSGYTSFTQTHDQQTLDLPRLLHVFSAGNSASSNCGYGAGAGWGNITGGHKVGKNVIAVGSLTATDDLSGFSSRGPSHDGRVKPDICAKGSGVYSTVSNGSLYDTYSGTSMSCPNVSGILAQLYDAYRQNNNNQWANSALMKAIILNTADDLGNPGPDYKFGWGRINALRAAKVIENKSYFNNTVQQGTVRQHQINVPSGAQELRVMVYWHDEVAAVGAAKALVNDIDMTVSTPGGSSVQPWILDPTPDPTILDQPAFRGVDTLNNVEQVTISNPSAGNYTVLVNGNTIPQGPQPYYVVYEIRYNSLEVTYPIGGESWVPNEQEIIRWDAGSSSGSFTLEWTSNNGASWQTIATNVNGDERQYVWNAPNTVTGQARVRVSNGSLSAQSNAPFSIIDVPQNLEVIWSCGDSLKLKWDEVPEAEEYEVSQLGSKYMDSIGRTSALHFTVKGLNPTGTHWFSVRALNNNGASGRRARAIQKTPGDINCIPFNPGVSEVVSPSASSYSTCIASAGLPVTIKVTNSGVSTIDTIPVAYQINNGMVVWDTIYTPLPSAEEVTHTFTAGTGPLNDGNYTITAWTAFPQDQVPGNDTLVETFSVFTSGFANLPYTQNFDNFTNCTTSWGCSEISCTLSNNWHNAENNVADILDWRTNDGGTASGSTGPNGDHTSGNGKYLYIEGSGNGGSGCQNAEALLYSPCFDLSQTNQPELFFWSHMEGNSIGELAVDVFDGIQWYNNLSLHIGEQGSAWFQDSIDLAAFEGDTINIRFRGITGNGWQTDIALDDINLFTLPTSRFTLNDSIGCPGNLLTLQSESWYATSQEWIITGGAHQFVNGTVATDPTVTVRLDDETTYTISLVTYNNFGNDTLTLTEAFFTGPHPLTITNDDADNAICPGTPVNFTADSYADNYAWFLNGTLVQNGPPNTFSLPLINQDTWVIGQGSLDDGCLTVQDSIFMEVSQLSTQAQQNSPVSCAGDSNGTATIIPANGITPYQFNWANGTTTAQTTGLSAGVHQYTVTDVTGCEATGSVTIQAPQPLQAQTNHIDPICFGGSNGQASVNGSGGNGNYSATWSTGAPGLIVNGLQAGTYQVTLTDAKGCTTEDSVVLTNPDPIEVQTVALEPADCFGQASGSATVTAVQGTRPYNWQWSNGANDSSIQQVAAGTYRVTVTDANNCRQIDSVTITQPATSLTVAMQETDIACHGDSTGTAGVLATGGVGPYTYQWSNGANGTMLSDLPAGTFYVTITDQNQCGALDSVVIDQPAPITAQAITQEDVACFGDSTGQLIIQAQGGTGTLSANWQDGAAGWQRQQIPAGQYTVTITDQNQCTLTDSFTIEQPEPLAIHTLTFSDSICAETTTGIVHVNSTGGVGTHSYQWSNGQSGDSLHLLSTGLYTVTLTDGNGCTATASYTIAAFPEVPLIIEPGQDTIVCPGELVQLIALGNFTNHTWSTGANTQQITANAGFYAVSAIDSYGCRAESDTIHIDEHPVPTATSISGEDTVELNENTSYSTFGNAGSSYQWQVSGGQITSGQGSAGVAITWQQLGWQEITAIETTAEGCTGDTIRYTVWVDRVSSVSQPTSLAIQVYPNPTQGQVTLEGWQHPALIRVLDVTGQLVYQTAVADSYHQIDLGAVAQGMYLIEVRTSAGFWSSKILKQ